MLQLLDAPLVNMHEAKTNLSRMARDIEDGACPYYVIARRGKPILKLSLWGEAPDKSRRIGAAKGLFACPDDDFFYDGTIEEAFGEYL